MAPGDDPSAEAELRKSVDVAPSDRSVIGPTVVLRGDLSAGDGLMIIGGVVQGHVTGETVVIRKSARMQGSVSAAHIVLELGARFDNVVLDGRIGRSLNADPE